MRKRILLVMGDEKLREKCERMLRPFEGRHAIRVVRNYNHAYKSAVDMAVDLIICGPSKDPYGKCMLEAFQFIQVIRNYRQHSLTPVILISDVEDPSNYCYRQLHCMDVIDTLSVEERLAEVVRQSLELDIRACEDRFFYIEEQNVLYPIRCNEISHVQAVSRALKITLQDGSMQELRYMTLQQFMEAMDRRYFLQCSRSGIVNIEFIQNVDCTNRMITMKNQEQMAIGSTFLKHMHERFPSIREIWQQKQLRADA